MNRTFCIVGALAALASAAPAAAQTGSAKPKYFARVVVTPRPVTAPAAAKTPTRCSMADHTYADLSGGGNWEVLGTIQGQMTGTVEQTKAMINAYCESFDRANVCEGYIYDGNQYVGSASYSPQSKFHPDTFMEQSWAGNCTPAH